MEHLAGRVAVVTGAGSGIGRALAERFVAERMKVVLADISIERVQRVGDALTRAGGDVTTQVCDTSREADVVDLARRSNDAYGAVHVLCNNAGVMGTADAWVGPFSEWEWILGVNLYGVIHGVRAFLPIMATQGEGHIVNTASMSGLTTMPGAAPYVVSKHGVVALSETLYVELKCAGSPIGVSVLCPGFVRTDLMDAPWDEALGARPPPATEPVATKTHGLLRDGIEAGMPAAEVACQVVAAIRAEQFWILTHEEVRKDPLERFRRAARQENPALGPPPRHPHLSRAVRTLRTKLPPARGRGDTPGL